MRDDGYNLPKSYYGDQEDILEEFENDWHVKQGYDDCYAKQFRCKICGSDKFEVGHGSYFTAIRCPICRYEICIHDG